MRTSSVILSGALTFESLKFFVLENLLHNTFWHFDICISSQPHATPREFLLRSWSAQSGVSSATVVPRLCLPGRSQNHTPSGWRRRPASRPAQLRQPMYCLQTSGLAALCRGHPPCEGDMSRDYTTVSNGRAANRPWFQTKFYFRKDCYNFEFRIIKSWPCVSRSRNWHTSNGEMIQPSNIVQGEYKYRP